MAILVLGAGGFIGGRIVRALRAAGYDVREGRRPAIDMARLQQAAQWAPLLENCDAVVNAVGIFREGPGATFDALQARGPMALFDACAARGIPVIQVSALGADEDAPTAFLRSKARADDHLASLSVPHAVLRPSLVFGEEGASARLFMTLASLPAIPLPGAGRQLIQPVHVEDVATAVVALLKERRFTASPVPAVGPQPLTLREYLAALRRGLGLGSALFIGVPQAVMAFAARFRRGFLDPDALAMLERGNTAEAASFAAILGRPPRAADTFATPAMRRDASLGWLVPLLRLALAFMWLAAALVSAGLYPVEESRAMLARVGLSDAMATLALGGAVAFDLALGIATLFIRRRALWTLQVLLVLAYTAIITVFLPEQWLHPFGPVVKNVPILAVLLLMRELEPR
jgi:uncharacterized protein YbjT (DUF2867 family)